MEYWSIFDSKVKTGKLIFFHGRQILREEGGEKLVLNRLISDTFASVNRDRGNRNIFFFFFQDQNMET